ncbi:8-oxo-dGDP phosphatase NUDT18-like [Acanthaster planci]|uniref:8-oxo-dGDP phosphatase NUDT18-like n=1 Tax=Acanthaster planci TaxID=133434 RepID=A0A8B7Z3L5_ACAPL|nr:8-oxo-dGDP phosphatase NUDT18-like [Acanthaster planci]XP_022099366.1 8-oxo-dGDP phosphatase NUDT18-like [Acanthaster planci]XP_022099367.1 8-oxo-dGDP phosphatase NUDT18-like [Acanthaster planci]XP_022099368.1 8-oxo-dGDP phosphatase NUDT18-like [Acanthaster planci]XP_022099369.1 8-oxo-dGDP phosphatase NUDT18-like [Acanthaster planci]XP_022099370.1 8-oxo-dGDP phosphatase NUDT18-like [Acanthaster planci]
MSEIERCLANLLAGCPPPVPVPKYDFFFKAPAKTHQRPLVLRDNLSIIVAAVIFDDKCRVVLIQEAKESCRGRWYLPAGHSEPNETLQEAIQREVLEETGLEFQPSTVVRVESNHLFGYWMRFTFIGYITGGRLKTLEEADKESLQAKWTTIEDIQGQVDIKLRAHDAVYLIQTALAYLQRDPIKRHANVLPVLNPHKHMCIRVILIKRLQDEVHVLLSMEDKPHFPIIKGTSIAEEALRTLDKETFSASNGYFLRGLLCIEHLGRPHGSADGVCLNLLAVTDFQRDLKNPNFMWHHITNPEIQTTLYNRIQEYRCLNCP